MAEGILFETEVDSEALLCWGGGWIGDIGCFGDVIVPVQGVDVRELPGSETDPNVPDLPARTWATYWVRVIGVWEDGAIEATRVADAEQPSFFILAPIPEVPCAPPLSGWHSTSGMLPGDAEERWAELEREVSRNPDTYAGISSAVITGGHERMTATVVGTLVDPAMVDRTLRTIWSYNLCINRVDHSAAELDEVANSVRAMDGTWAVQEQYGHGHVSVRVPVFDHQTADALAPYIQLLDVRPIVSSQTAAASPSPSITRSESPPVSMPTLTPRRTVWPTPLKSPDPLTSLPTVVRDGDPVVAFGHLFESESGGLLCQLVIALAPQTPPRCAFDVLAPVTGVDVRQIGGEVGGQWVTDYVRVEGVWTGGAIAANMVEPVERPRATEILSPLGSPGVPCEPPPEGWSRYPDGPDGERAADALEAEVESHPEKYSGLWNGEVIGAHGNTVDLVVVVGTVEDVESIAAELRSIYPFNLCVTHADYGRREMQDVVESLSAGYPDWDIYVAPSIGQIVVRLPAFDSDAAGAVRPYEHQVVVLPIVRHAAGSALDD